jgi:hypothetical protein
VSVVTEWLYNMYTIDIISNCVVSKDCCNSSTIIIIIIIIIQFFIIYVLSQQL